MKKARLFSISIFLFLFHWTASGQVLPDSAQLGAWNDFNNSYQNKWTLRWDNETGTPASIYGGKTTPYSSLTDPEGIARQFLKDHRTIFKMRSDLSDLSLLRSLESRGVHVVDFQQFYEGIPVFGGEYSVAVGPDKTVQTVGGKYYASVISTTTPAIGPAGALEYALKAVGIYPSAIRESEVNLVVAPNAGGFALAYRVLLNEWALIVDASDGQIIRRFERILRIDGTGNIYPKDPVNSSLSTVTIPRLLGGGTTLDGTYIKATNAELGDAYSASRDFRYSPPTYTQHDATHFDDANIYHHVDTMAHSYWANIGYAVPFKSIASVHDSYPYGHDNAAANISSGALYFGHGASIFWDLAKKEDVIYHEYTHAVSGHIGLGLTYAEEQALHEGYSDYHAATFTNQHQIGEWVIRNYSDLRTLATSAATFNYNNLNQVSYTINYAGSPHANSMIWSGALWDLRNQLGPTITDFLVYQGLVYRHTSNTTFLSAREGIIIADQNFYGGAHLYTIQHTFYLRGIGADGVPPLAVTMSGPATVYHPAKGTVNQYTWTSNVTGGTPPYSYAWTKNGSPVGTSSSYTEYFSFNGWDCDSYQFTLRVDVTGGGSAYATKTVTAWNSCGGESQAATSTMAQIIPSEFSVEQNFPNPFNPETEISFALPEPSSVKIVVSDMLGREIVTLVDRHYSAGYQRVTWKGTDRSGNKIGSGVYLCRIVATGQNGKQFMKVMKMALTK